MTKEVLQSNTLIIDGCNSDHDRNYYFSADPVNAFEIFTKKEGILQKVAVHYDHNQDAFKDIIRYLLVRAKVGMRYPLQEITIYTSSPEVWQQTGEVLKQAGYPVAWVTE